MNKLNCVALALLIGGTAACADVSAPAVTVEPAELPARPALNVAAAARVAVVIEDALTRLVSDDGAALDVRLRELAAMLATADATTLGRQIERTLRALDDHGMAGADADALRLALALVDGGEDTGVGMVPHSLEID